MGVLKRFNTQRKQNSTKGFYFGATEAEAENIEGQDLLEYFDDYLEIIPLIEKGRFIFVGRKGAGKSAIAKYIKDSTENQEDSFADLLKMHVHYVSIG